MTNPLDIERGLDRRPAGPADPGQPRPRRTSQGTGHRPQAGRPRHGRSPRRPPLVEPTDLVWRTLGLKLVPVAAEYVTAASAQLHGGLYVEAVTPGGPAAKPSIQKGDILVGMIVGKRHWETIRSDNVVYILRQTEASQTQNLPFYIVRRNNIQARARCSSLARSGDPRMVDHLSDRGSARR